ncbi:calcium-binding protein [Tistrella sp. BH-R2-4]|uniref:Calcium-binding protein n=1 Tax=Tistrella arctica TaxID=3133430 RepID=A0ABU9YHN7_9PROT
MAAVLTLPSISGYRFYADHLSRESYVETETGTATDVSIPYGADVQLGDRTLKAYTNVKGPTNYADDGLIITNEAVTGGSGDDIIHGWQTINGGAGDDILVGVRTGTIFAVASNAGDDIVSDDSVGFGAIKLVDTLLSDITYTADSSFTPGEGFTIQLGSGSISADTANVRTIIDRAGNVLELRPLTGLPPLPALPETDDNVVIHAGESAHDTRGSDVYSIATTGNGPVYELTFDTLNANPGDIDTIRSTSVYGYIYVHGEVSGTRTGNGVLLRLDEFDAERGIDVAHYVFIIDFFGEFGNTNVNVYTWNGYEYEDLYFQPINNREPIGTSGNDSLTAPVDTDEFGNHLGHTVYGLAGDDTITILTGPHLLYGGTGDDTYVLTNYGNGGFATIIDDAGSNDRLIVTRFDADAASAYGSNTVYTNFLQYIAGIYRQSSGIDFLEADGNTGTLWGWGTYGPGLAGMVAAVPQWPSDGVFNGTSGDDILFAEVQSAGLGQAVDGGAGRDMITGSALADDLRGGSNNDLLFGRAGDDILTGGSGNDILSPGAGVDRVDGGTGIDTVDYDGSLSVRVDLSVGQGVGGDALNDRYISIENITGSQFADILIGDAGVNRLSGNSGSDTLIGGAGADALDGGIGIDTVSYSNASSGVRVFLTTMRGELGDAQGDTFANIEAVNGSQFDDMIFAGSSSTRFKLNGLGGDDILFAADTAADFIGGAGFDTLSYSAFTSRVVVSLDPEDQLGSAGRADLISEIEGLNGSQADDLLYGNSGANALGGLDGEDVLFGGGGGDALDGGAGLDTASYTTARAGIRADLAAGRGFTGDAQGDTYLAIEALNGSNFDDLLLGDNAANTLKGMNGDDRLAGRGGVDLLTGGNGADRFVYSATTESRVGPGNRDIILDFSHAQGDRIDLANIDARPADAGDQAFRFLGTDAFDGNAGALRYINAGSYSVIEIDTNGDRVTDMQIQVNGVNSFVAGDFIL